MTGTDPTPNYRWLRPFIKLLRQGVSPEKIALTISLGIILGVTPVLGSTVLLCTLAAIVLRLNLPAIQLVNGLVSILSSSSCWFLSTGWVRGWFERTLQQFRSAASRR